MALVVINETLSHNDYFCSGLLYVVVAMMMEHDDDVVVKNWGDYGSDLFYRLPTSPMKINSLFYIFKIQIS